MEATSVAPASEARMKGVSLRFLSDFASKIPQELTTAQILHKYIAPKTNGKPFTDLVALKYVGDAQHYVIHSWNGNFLSDLVVPMLQHFIGDPNSDATVRSAILANTFVWIDCFCLPQQPPSSPPPELEQRRAAVHNAIAQCSTVLLMLDSSAVALSRTWCLYELWRTASSKGADALHIPIFEFPLDVVYDQILAVDLANSRSTLPGDKDALVAAVTTFHHQQPGAASASPRLSPRLSGPLGQANKAIISAIQDALVGEAQRLITAGTRSGPRYLSCLRKSAETLRLGKAQLADVLAQASLKEHKRALGEADPATLAATSNLALLRRSQGRVAEAEVLLRQVLEGRQHTLGADHPDTAASSDNLAWVLQDQGKLDEASTYYRQALDISRRTLGADHPDTASSANNLAGVLQALGRHDEAEPLLKSALEVTSRTLGENHPHTATSCNNLGVLYKAKGDAKAAEEYFKRAYAVTSSVLGPDHPDTLTALRNLETVQQPHSAAQAIVGSRPASSQPAGGAAAKPAAASDPRLDRIKEEQADLDRAGAEESEERLFAEDDVDEDFGPEKIATVVAHSRPSSSMPPGRGSAAASPRPPSSGTIRRPLGSRPASGIGPAAGAAPVARPASALHQKLLAAANAAAGALDSAPAAFAFGHPEAQPRVAAPPSPPLSPQAGGGGDAARSLSPLFSDPAHAPALLRADSPVRTSASGKRTLDEMALGVVSAHGGVSPGRRSRPASSHLPRDVSPGARSRPLSGRGSGTGERERLHVIRPSVSARLAEIRNDPEAEAKILQIQAYQRGRLARKQVAELRSQRAAAAAGAAEPAAAGGPAADQDQLDVANLALPPDAEEKARLIQACQRGRMARKQVQEMRRQRQDQQQQQQQEPMKPAQPAAAATASPASKAPEPEPAADKPPSAAKAPKPAPKPGAAKGGRSSLSKLGPSTAGPATGKPASSSADGRAASLSRSSSSAGRAPAPASPARSPSPSRAGSKSGLMPTASPGKPVRPAPHSPRQASSTPSSSRPGSGSPSRSTSASQLAPLAAGAPGSPRSGSPSRTASINGRPTAPSSPLRSTSTKSLAGLPAEPATTPRGSGAGAAAPGRSALLKAASEAGNGPATAPAAAAMPSRSASARPAVAAAPPQSPSAAVAGLSRLAAKGPAPVQAWGDAPPGSPSAAKLPPQPATPPQPVSPPSNRSPQRPQSRNRAIAAQRAALAGSGSGSSSPCASPVIGRSSKSAMLPGSDLQSPGDQLNRPCSPGMPGRSTCSMVAPPVGGSSSLRPSSIAGRAPPGETHVTASYVPTPYISIQDYFRSPEAALQAIGDGCDPNGARLSGGGEVPGLHPGLLNTALNQYRIMLARDSVQQSALDARALMDLKLHYVKLAVDQALTGSSQPEPGGVPGAVGDGPGSQAELQQTLQALVSELAGLKGALASTAEELGKEQAARSALAHDMAELQKRLTDTLHGDGKDGFGGASAASSRSLAARSHAGGARDQEDPAMVAEAMRLEAEVQQAEAKALREELERTKEELATVKQAEARARQEAEELAAQPRGLLGCFGSPARRPRVHPAA